MFCTLAPLQNEPSSAHRPSLVPREDRVGSGAPCPAEDLEPPADAASGEPFATMTPGGQELEWLAPLITSRRLIAKGSALFRSGDHFERLALVSSGCFKTCAGTREGREQVIGFHFAGELLGLDGICRGLHDCEAIALEDSQVGLMPYAEVERLSRKSTALQRQFHRLMSREILRGQGVMLLLGGMRAEERVAAFLLHLASRMKSLGFSPSRIVLRMTREEIGSHLGLTLETISRTLSRFQNEGVIAIRQREVTILKARRLSRLVNRSLR